MVVNHDEFMKKLNNGIYSDNGNAEPGLQEPGSSHTSASWVFTTAKAAGANLPSSKKKKEQIEQMKEYFCCEGNLKTYLDSNLLSGGKPLDLAIASVALAEMGRYQEAHQVFEALKEKKKTYKDYWKNRKPFTLATLKEFMKTLRSGDVSAAELKAAFDKFVAHKNEIRTELTSRP